jgi:hypothetical protein
VEERTVKIVDHFIGTGAGANPRIEILSGGGAPLPIPREWRPVMDSCDALVVIPDMHMFVRNSPQDNFHFGAEAFLSFLDHLETRKEDFAAAGNTLRIYQTGDLFELRFPSPTNAGANVGAAEIRMSDPEYDLIINRLDHLRTHFIYGNHDFEDRHYPGYRFYAGEGRVYLEHGFAASPWTEDPRHPLWDPAMFGFMTLRDIEAQYIKLAVAAHAIGKDDHFAVGTIDGKIERGGYPDESGYPAAVLSHYTGKLFSDPGVPDPRIRIIGHTHHPLLRLVAPAGGGGCILADAGAWTEGRSDFAVVTDEEIAICRYKRA